MEDTRNLVDKYKGLPLEQILEQLEQNRTSLEVAIENVSHDFNLGTIVRSANNFNASKVHIIGRKKCNRRGAMCTDKYLTIEYWSSIDEFIEDQRLRERELVAIENNVSGEILEKIFGSKEICPRGLADKKFVQSTTLVFGSESNGISDELLGKVDDIREIEGLGSTRSVNVGVAAGIAMYEWARQCVLECKR